MSEYRRLLKVYQGIQEEYADRTHLSQDEFSDICQRMKSKDGRSMMDHKIDEMELHSELCILCGLGIIVLIILVAIFA